MSGFCLMNVLTTSFASSKNSSLDMASFRFSTANRKSKSCFRRVCRNVIKLSWPPWDESALVRKCECADRAKSTLANLSNLLSTCSELVKRVLPLRCCFKSGDSFTIEEMVDA